MLTRDGKAGAEKEHTEAARAAMMRLTKRNEAKDVGIKKKYYSFAPFIRLQRMMDFAIPSGLFRLEVHRYLTTDGSIFEGHTILWDL